MTPQGLLASAAINISLAMAVLFLFSVLKKHPSNAAVYYARRLADRRPIAFHSFSLRRLLPSVSWIRRALRVSEDEIVCDSGLDALIIIRLFKFGIRFFVVCSLVGLLVLLPLNYHGEDGQSTGSHTMNAFTISNISAGSNELWVHFSCLCFISFYGLYLLYKEYKGILAKRIQQLHNLRGRPDRFTVLVREIPPCAEHRSHGCSVYHFFTKHYGFGYLSYQVLYDGTDLDVLQNEAIAISRKLQHLKEKSFQKKSNTKSPLLEKLQGDASEIALHEKKLQKICDVIRRIQSETVLQKMELPVAFVTFKSRVGAALAAQSLQHPHPFCWITEEAPEPRDIVWQNLSTSSRKLLLYKIGFFLAATILTIFFTVPVAAVQGIAKFEKLKKWFPPAMAVQLIPGLRSIVTGYLPSVILNGFIYIIPYSMLGMAQLAGYISRSETQIKVCSMVFYFLVGNVFFLSLLSGSLLDQLGVSFGHPGDFPSRLAHAVAAQADFFTTYILSDGLFGFSLEALQAGLLLWDVIKSHTYGRGKEKTPYLYCLPYFRVIPIVCLSILIGTVYAVIAPLMLPFVVGYLYLGYAVYINQIEDVYASVYETCGRYWPYIHSYITFGIILMQITMIGLFGLKKKPEASIATIPLLIFTILFNEYCKLRFLPSFQHYAIKTAKEDDELDEKDGTLEANSRNAVAAYRSPFLKPVCSTEAESSSHSSA